MPTNAPVTGRGLAARLRRDHRGSVAMWAALVIPALAVLSVGATELAVLAADRAKVQDAADAAALAAAGELGVASPGAVARAAEAEVLMRLSDLARRSSVRAHAHLIDGNTAVRLRVVSRRPSFFGDLLPPGGFHIAAVSTATRASETSLCLIGLREASEPIVSLTGSADIRAPGCLVHSNGNLAAAAQSRVEAGAVQAVGSVTGQVAPAGQPGAPAIEDPFAQRDIRVRGCGLLTGVLSILLDFGSGSRTLEADEHCGHVRVRDTGHLHLAPGEHHFNGDLIIGDRARLTGDDVVLMFARGSRLIFEGRADVDLKGLRAGPRAGLLIVTARDNDETFTISSDSARRLEGVVYMPAATLAVSGTGTVAAQSNWTVTVTRNLRIEGSPTLVINADYGASPVPVPEGVGPRTGGTRLLR